MFLLYLKEQNIQIYSTISDLKAVFVERFSRTLLDLIKESKCIEGKACWLNHLDAAMRKLNKRVRTTARTTRFEASNDKLIPCKNIPNENKLPKFQVGDFVRVPDKRNLYGGGYTTKWSREFFKRHKIHPTNAVTYGLEVENNEQNEGK